MKAAHVSKSLVKLLIFVLFGSGALVLVPQLFASHHVGALFLMQFKMTIPLAEIHKSPRDAVAVRDLSQARRSVLVAHEEVQKATEKVQENSQDSAAQKAAADAQKALEEAQKQVQQATQEVAASPEQKIVVAAAQVERLQEQLESFRNHNETQRSFNSKLAVAFIVAGIVLALVTSICSFFGLMKTAGVLSLVVGALVSIPKVIPVNERAEYYRVLSSQSYNLLLESRLQIDTTVDQYNDSVRRLQILFTYETEKYPASGNTAQVTQELIRDLQAAKTTNTAKT